MAAQSATTLYHLLPAAEWEASQAAGKLYTPRTYAADGFVHLSADADALVDIGNHFYGSIPGDFLVLSLDASKLTSPYGPINADAVTEVTAVDRTPSGKMLGLLWGIAVVHNRGDWLKLAAS